MSTDENEEFAIRGESGDCIRIIFTEVYGFPNETCHWGGYDMRATVKIKTGDFGVSSNFFTSTGEIYNLYQQLKSCNAQLDGVLKFASYEGNLEFTANYGQGGHIDLVGRYISNNQYGNELRFGIVTDQSYMSETITELSSLFLKYGDDSGVKS